jgi:hypothetical protein
MKITVVHTEEKEIFDRFLAGHGVECEVGSAPQALNGGATKGVPVAKQLVESIRASDMSMAQMPAYRIKAYVRNIYFLLGYGGGHYKHVDNRKVYYSYDRFGYKTVEPVFC